VSHLPGIIAAFEPLALPGSLLPTSRFNPGVNFTWKRRFDCEHALSRLKQTTIYLSQIFFVVYKKLKSETISVLPFLVGKPTIYTSNLDVARQVVAGGVKSPWIKPEETSIFVL
jgi:hypothetical protein